MLTNAVPHILFELTIFLLLSVQLYDLTKKYILPILRKQIKELKKGWLDLQEQKQLAIKTKQKLRKKIDDQEKELDTLEEKISAWHAKIIEKNNLLKKREESVYTKLFEKKKNQLAYMEQKKSDQQVIPEAIRKAKEKLEEDLCNTKGKKLLVNVISEMGKL